MNRVTVKMKDGTDRHFKETRSDRDGKNTVRYEVGFVVVTNVWGKETAIPASDVLEVEFSPEQRGRW